MATEVILPRVDMDMAEGKIACWYVKNGDQVRKGQVLFDIETDKATMEVEAPATGVIDSIDGAIGVTMPVGQVVAWIRAPGAARVEGTSAPPAARQATGTAATAAVPEPGHATAMSPPAPMVSTAAELPFRSDGTSLRATPLARSLARERGVDLLRLRGSGPGGRIVGRDVPATSTSSPGGADTKPKPKLHLHWWRHGKVPVLLLHGFGADHASWRPLVEQLPPEIPLAGVDLPCHGKSPVQSAGSMQAMAQAVLDRLEQEGIAACHLLGHSLGGGVALALAAAQPQRVRSLSLLAPAGLGPEINGDFIDGLTRAETQAALQSTLALLLHDPAALTGSFVATAFHLLQAPARRAALSGMAFQLMPGGIQQQNLRRELDALPMPTKLIWGIADRIIPAAHGAGVPGGVALHLLPGVGHLPQVEATALVARLLQHQWRAGTAA